MLKRFFRLSTSAILLVGGVSLAGESKLVAASGNHRVQLVELYSSESCSSCPPADSWISSLQESPGLWKNFVPIVFHVDYWNQLGWRDGFSSELMTKRQVSLANQWAKPSVYTPAIIVDGKEWQDWRNQGKSFPSPAATKIEIKIFVTSGNSFQIRTSGLGSKKHYIVRVAELGMGLLTDVTGGENSGRVLKHNFVVLDWSTKEVSSKASEQTFSFKTTNQKPGRLAIAAWVEEEGSPTPLQSTGGYL